MNESAWTKILGWPGYRVYRSEINEAAKTLRLWVRRKPDRANAKLAYQDFLTLWKYANPDILLQARFWPTSGLPTNTGVEQLDQHCAVSKDLPLSAGRVLPPQWSI